MPMGSIKDELRRMTAQARSQVRMMQASIVRNVPVTPRLRRITLGGPDLVRYAGWRPADAVRLYLPEPGQRAPRLPVRDENGGAPDDPVFDNTAPTRAYTLRRYDRQRLEADIDVVLHGSGAGAQWARSAEVGDRVALAGPRRDFYSGDGVDWHLIAGDETALPAIAGILSELPAGMPVLCHVEVEDESDEVALPSDADVTLRWWHRRADAPASTDLLFNALSAASLPEGTGQAWVAAEASVMRSIRRYLLTEAGLLGQNVHAVAYWRRGVDQTELDRRAMEQVQQALVAGRALDELDPGEFEPV
jgi:NADPH-dependent ferric siderophore reductase